MISLKRIISIFIVSIFIFISLIGLGIPSRNVSNSIVNAQEIEYPPGLNETQFMVIASGGLGDVSNAYPWSIEVFKGKIFIGIGKVGTITQPLIIFLVDLLNLTLDPEIENAIHGGYWSPYITDWANITRPPGTWEVINCTAYRIWREANRAEIWFYDPEVHRWFLSYRADLVNVSELFVNPHICDTPFDEHKGIWVPIAMGFRAMKVHNNCLYVGVGGISGMFATKTYQPPLLLRTCNGIDWEIVPTPPEMGIDTRTIESHNGWIYVGSTSRGLLGGEQALIWGAPGHPDSPDDWILVGNLTGDTVPSIGNNLVVSLKSFNGYLYAGTSNFRYGCEVWRSRVSNPIDPKNDWIKMFDYGGGDMMNYWAGTMKIYNNTLYVGTMLWPFIFGSDESSRPKFMLRGFDIFEIYPNDTWDLLVGAYIPRRPVDGWVYDDYINIVINGTLITVPIRIPRSYYPSGFGNLFNIYDWSMEEYNNIIYVGTMDWSTFLHFVSIENLLQLFGIDEEEINETIELVINDLRTALDYINQSGKIPEKYIDILANLIDELERIVEEEDLTQKLEDLKELFLQYFGGADLWKSENDTTWIPVTLNGFNNSYNYGIRVMKVGPGSTEKLYVGMANPFDGMGILRAPEAPPVVGGLIQILHDNNETNSQEIYHVLISLIVLALVIIVGTILRLRTKTF